MVRRACSYFVRFRRKEAHQLGPMNGEDEKESKERKNRKSMMYSKSSLAYTAGANGINHKDVSSRIHQVNEASRPKAMPGQRKGRVYSYRKIYALTTNDEGFLPCIWGRLAQIRRDFSSRI